MISRIAVMALIVGLSACSGMGVKGDRSIERNGDVYVDLLELKVQLQSRGSMDHDLMTTTLQRLTAEARWLGLADYYYLEGTQSFLTMGAGGLDSENYQQALRSLELSAQYYDDLDEEWLQAQSMWMLALTNMRAGKPDETCDYYNRTLKLLNRPSGKLKEFNYEHEKFEAPQDYVKGVLGEACSILEAQKTVAKNSQ